MTLQAPEPEKATLLDDARAHVLHVSEPLPEDTPQIKGYDFNQGVSFDSLMSTFLHTGFQATNLGLAIDEVNRMRKWRLSQVPVRPDEKEELRDPSVRANIRCKIYLSYTSNMVSSGVREVIRYLVQHKMVDVLVTTAGGVEEDFIKCLAPTLLGDFSLKGKDLRKRGLNRIGNLLVPNDNYCQFESWIMPILGKMAEEQSRDGVRWTPSRIINRLGKEIDNPESIYYWAYKNDIPVFCPAITDGSLGDMIYFFSHQRPDFVVDLVEDIKRINDSVIKAHCTGMIILGGGLVKHHVCNANMMRNGADFSVFINTGQEFDGSDAGAKPDEAVSWGKIRAEARPVKVFADATLVFPLLVSQTFAKDSNGASSSSSSSLLNGTGKEHCNGHGGC